MPAPAPAAVTLAADILAPVRRALAAASLARGCLSIICVTRWCCMGATVRAASRLRISESIDYPGTRKASYHRSLRVQLFDLSIGWGRGDDEWSNSTNAIRFDR